jgi:hypothetical protein
MAKLGSWQRQILRQLATHGRQSAQALGAGEGDTSTKTARYLVTRALRQLVKRQLVEHWPHLGYMLTLQGVEVIETSPWFAKKGDKNL